jgi:protein CpxP
MDADMQGRLVSMVKLTRRIFMNQGKFKFRHAARAMAAAAIVATTAFVTAPVVTAAVPAPAVAATNGSDQVRIEARIKDMHAKLKITANEEDQWGKVADVMRDNAQKMGELNRTRLANANSMNAVDDLNSYGEVVDAHASEIKKFAAAFSPLYASMSDTQKAEADELFRHGDTQHKATQKK